MSEVKNLAQMGLSEIFEDLTYNVAYSEVLSRLNKNIPVQDGYLKDALQSGLSIVFAGALQSFIKKENDILNSIVSYLDAILILLLGKLKLRFSQFANRFKSRGRKRFLKGRFGRSVVSLFNDLEQNRFEFAKTYNDYVSNRSLVQHSKYMTQDNYQFASMNALKTDNLAVQTRLMAVREMTSSINETLLFKLFTGKFTAKDRAILQKITGSDKVDIDSINKASSFMFVTDDKGNIIGLTQAFIDMLNGLGYLRGKERKE